MSDVRRLVYALELHRGTPKDDLNQIEVELYRRIFWEAYVIDK